MFSDRRQEYGVGGTYISSPGVIVRQRRRTYRDPTGRKQHVLAPRAVGNWWRSSSGSHIATIRGVHDVRNGNKGDQTPEQPQQMQKAQHRQRLRTWGLLQDNPGPGCCLQPALGWSGQVNHDDSRWNTYLVSRSAACCQAPCSSRGRNKNGHGTQGQSHGLNDSMGIASGSCDAVDRY
jgi:hypothetical protein